MIRRVRDLSVTNVSIIYGIARVTPHNHLGAHFGFFQEDGRMKKKTVPCTFPPPPSVRVLHNSKEDRFSPSCVHPCGGEILGDSQHTRVCRTVFFFLQVFIY